MDLASSGRTRASTANMLWLTDGYRRSEFDVMVLARIVEPVSKFATIGAREEIEIWPVYRNRLAASLKRGCPAC